jgi:hypothetical protein
MFNDLSSDDWSRLGLFLSRDVLERRYQVRHQKKLGADKAKEIIAHLDQARRYFKSAETAGVLAGPLEQYYGVLAFSRAIILYLNPSMRETSLKKAHGLSAALPSDGGVEEVMFEVQSGTFDELLDSTKNSQEATLDQHSPGVVTMRSYYEHILPRPPMSTIFSLLDLLARIPGLRAHFESAFAKRAHCHSGVVWQFANTLSVDISKDRFDLPSIEELRTSLGITASASAVLTRSQGVQFTYSVPLGETPLAPLPNVITSRIGERCLVEQFTSGGWWLNELASYFAASHALSMLVRYYPSRWARMVSHEKGDRLLPVLDRMRGLVQTEFIRLGLWQFDGTPA